MSRFLLVIVVGAIGCVGLHLALYAGYADSWNSLQHGTVIGAPTSEELNEFYSLDHTQSWHLIRHSELGASYWWFTLQDPLVVNQQFVGLTGKGHRIGFQVMRIGIPFRCIQRTRPESWLPATLPGDPMFSQSVLLVGALSNLVSMCIAALVIGWVYARLKRASRIVRNRCPICAYPIGGRICPECGTVLSQPASA